MLPLSSGSCNDTILGVGVGVAYCGYNVERARGKGEEKLQIDGIAGGGRCFGAQSRPQNLKIC